MWGIVEGVLSKAWQQFVSQCVSGLPNIIAGILFLLAGLACAMIAGRFSRLLLTRADVDGRASRLAAARWLERAGASSVTVFLVRALQGAIAAVTAVLILYAVAPEPASELTRQSLLYLPRLAVAAGLAAVGFAVSSFVGRSVLIGAVNLGVSPARLLGRLARAGVMAAAGVVALEHLGIGRTTLPAAFLIVLAGIALAAALAVGLGSQDAVRRWHEERRQRSASEDDGRVLHHW
jgi:hypothetical protein